MWTPWSHGVGALMLCASVGAQPPDRETLGAAWRGYVHDYVQSDGRVIDQTRGGATTSEGQAYVMLRAVWMDDPEVFRRVQRWNVDNLQGGDPSALPAWLWGEAEDGWHVLDPAPAADADLIIAWSTLLAAERWGEPGARDAALGLLRAIWDQEVLTIAGRTWLLPGPWARDRDPVPLNPSYFAPFIYRDLARVDPERDWASLIDPAYELLLSLAQEHHLPPDWVFLDRATGALTAPPPDSTATRGFGFEALRLPWLVQADAEWHRDGRARRLARTWSARLAERFERDRALLALVVPPAGAVTAYESGALYGSVLPAWAHSHAALVPRALARIDALAVPSPGTPAQGRDYYAANWVWFGLALWAGIARPLESS